MSYTTGVNNRLASDGTYNYTYDNEGNTLTKTRISDGQVTMNTWDYRNRLTEVVIQDAEDNVLTHDVFTYDVNDLRIGKSVDGLQTWTVYDQGNPYADFDASGSLTTRYLYGEGLDSLLAKMSAAGVTTWYLSDLLGSVRELVQTDGTVLDQISYDSYGNILTETAPSQGDRLKYAGRDWDGEIGLYYNWERYVDPATGRFESEDPTGFVPGDPNLGRYVGNNPINRTDPNGEDWASFVSDGLNASTFGLSNNILSSDTFGNVLNGTDQFFAGYADQMTGGRSTEIREDWYGESATQNHGGALFDAGGYVAMGQQVLMVSVSSVQLYNALASGGFTLGGGAMISPGGVIVLVPTVSGQAVGIAGAGGLACGGGIWIVESRKRSPKERKEHRKRARPSTEEKHEEGQATKDRSQKNEKGDKRRRYQR